MQIKNRFAIFLTLIGMTVLSVFPALAQTSYEFTGEVGSWHTAGNWTPNGVPGANDIVTVSNGFVTLDGIPVTVDDLTLNGGTIYGQGTLTVTGELLFTSGTMFGDSTVAGTDSIIVAAGASVRLFGTGTKILDNRVLVNEGSGSWENGTVRLTRNAIIQNDNTLDIEVSDRSMLFQGPDGGIFKNNGTLNKNVSADNATFTIEFQNNGTVNVNIGILELKRNSSATKAVYNIASGSEVELKAGPNVFDSLTVTGSGLLEILDSPFTVNGGGMRIDAPSTFTIIGSGSSMDGNGDLINDGQLNWTRADIAGSGNFINNGTLDIFGGNPKELGRPMTNNGQMNWSDAGTLRLTNAITLTNSPTGTFDIQNNALLFFLNSGGTIANQGTIVKSSGGNNFIDVPIENNGNFEIQSDTLFFRTTLTNDTAGTLMGNGHVDLTHLNANFFNSGDVNPGSSPGSLTIIGDLPMQSDASFSPELGGTGQVEEYDVLNVTGAAELNGTLEVSLINAFVPTTTDSFEVMKFGSRTGQFSSVVFPDYLVTPVYSDSNLVLTGIELSNQDPTANVDVAATNEDTPLDVNVLDDDTDPESDPLSISSFTQASNGTVTQQGDSTLRYQPNSNFFGADTFSYSISDGNGGSASAEVQLTVNAVNDPPVISPALADVSFQEDGSDTLDLSNAASDVDHDTTSLSWSANVIDAQPPVTKNGDNIKVGTGDLQVTINPATNKAAFTATADSGGVFTVVFTLMDPSEASDTDTITVTVNAENDDPVVSSPISDVIYNEDSGPHTVVGDLGVIFSDPDPGTTLTYSTSSLNANIQASIQGSSLVVNSTQDSSGVGLVVVTASDGNTSVNDTVQVTIQPVNDAPAISPALSDAAFNEDDSTTLSLTGAANDIDNAVTDLSWSAAAIGAGAGNIQVTIDAVTNIARIKSTADSNGVYQVVFTLNDLEPLSDTDTVQVTVNPVNDAPSVDLQNVVFPEDSSTTIALNNFATDIDDDVATLSWTAQVLSEGDGIGKNGSGISGLPQFDLQVSIDPLTNIATLTPTPDSIGVFEVKFTAMDTSLASASDTIIVTVANASDPPFVASAIQDVAFPEDSSPNTVVQDLNTVFSDPDATPMTFVATSSDVSVLASIDGDSLSIFTAVDFFGSSEIVVVAQDASGESVSDTFNVDITPVNDPPDLFNVPDTVIMFEDDTLLVDLDTLVIDVDDDLANLLWLGIFTDTSAANNIDVSLDFETNVVTIIPNMNFSIIDQNFALLVCDTSSACAQDTINFSILPVNDAPVFVDIPDTISFRADSTVSDTVWESITDDLTPDSLLAFEFSVSNDSLLFSFDSKTGLVTLFALPGFLGEVTFGIKATDEGGLSADTSLIVVVTDPLTGIEEVLTGGLLPKSFAVSQNYPNPFNPSTAIKFQVPVASDVRLSVYNILGQRVRTLVNQRMEAGSFEATWDGLNEQGARAASGVYIYRFEAGSYTKVMKMIMMK